MKWLWTSFILQTLVLLSCYKTEEKKEDYYYIIKHPQPSINSNKDTIDIPPPPSAKFYGIYNFVLYDTALIYYHKQPRDENYWCGTNYNFASPEIINLDANSLLEIKIEKLQSFLASIPDSVSNDRAFFNTISYPTDTIKNRGFKLITDFLKNRNLMKYSVRNCTEEELQVLKKKNFKGL